LDVISVSLIIAPEMQRKVLFVCLGNICRSPLAKALFEKHLEDHRLDHLFFCDSAGTSSQHQGQNADPRTLQNAAKNGLFFHHSARQFHPRDFDEFDHIIVMDRSNENNVLNLCRNEEHSVKVSRMRNWDVEMPGADVPDPWYSGEDGFEEVFRILERSTHALLHELSQK
jgi:protein-tyrosine phosphatase